MTSQLVINKKAALPTAKSNANTELEKSQFWVNVGYEVTVETSEGEETRFVSLNSGIALDRVQELKTNSSNAEWNHLCAAKNDLHSQLLEAANNLKPGESRIVQLAVEIRRVKDDAPIITSSENPFAVKLKF